MQTIPGRGCFSYMRVFGATAECFNDEYRFPTFNKVKDLSEYIEQAKWGRFVGAEEVTTTRIPVVGIILAVGVP